MMLFWSTPITSCTGLGAVIGSKAAEFLPSSSPLCVLMLESLHGCYGSVYFLLPSPPLPLQMWMSAWRVLTAVTLMPSARTHPSPTSASASPATPVMGSTVKVRMCCSNESQAPVKDAQPPQPTTNLFLDTNQHGVVILLCK